MLNDHGCLPEGIHQMSLAELRDAFGSFNGSDVRSRLFEKLERYVEVLVRCAWYRWLLVDGSFVTSKQRPSDIDLVLVVDGSFDKETTLLPLHYAVMSARRVKRQYGFDLFVAPEGSEALDHWITYFSGVAGSPLRKGLVRLRHE